MDVDRVARAGHVSGLNGPPRRGQPHLSAAARGLRSKRFRRTRPGNQPVEGLEVIGRRGLRLQGLFGRCLRCPVGHPGERGPTQPSIFLANRVADAPPILVSELACFRPVTSTVFRHCHKPRILGLFSGESWRPRERATGLASQAVAPKGSRQRPHPNRKHPAREGVFILFGCEGGSQEASRGGLAQFTHRWPDALPLDPGKAQPCL